MTGGALERELAGAFDANLPLLVRIPAGQVVQFLDYVAALEPMHRAHLRDELVANAVRMIARVAPAAPTPAIDRMRAALRGPGEFVGGWRYTDVRFLATLPRIAEIGGMERWLSAYSARAQEPRADLLPDKASVMPARAPLLRKLVKDALVRDGYAASPLAGGLRFLAGDVLVDVDFGSRMGQLRWSVATGATRPTHGLVELPFLSYESLWGLRGDWDMLTEENAARSVALMPALVRETVRLRALRD